MKSRSYTLKGVCPLVMHNPRLSDPLDKWSKLMKEISGKKKKTDDDLVELSRREWNGGLYWTPELGVHVPENCLERMLRDGGTKTKRGKDVLAGLIVVEPAKLIYPGPKSPEAMWESGDFLLRASAGVNQSRVIRSRPIFRQWELTFKVDYDESLLDAAEIDGFAEIAGKHCGLLDWRPKHGRFNVEDAK